MTRLIALSLLLACGLTATAAAPLRVYIRSGPKTHGPGAHDHPSFLRDWVPLLNERGLKASGADEFPTKEILDQTDVLIIHRDGGGDFKAEEKPLLDEFTKRGGGIVVIHAGSVSNTDPEYYKGLIGGSWHRPNTKWLEGPMDLYFTDHANPITKDCSNFEMDDEIYYDMDLSPDIHILAAAYTPNPLGARNEKAMEKAKQLTQGGKKVSVYDIQPQVWTYEKDQYRAFVCIPGHNYVNFSRPNFRALLLRGIAWVGKQPNADIYCKPEELGENLRYVEGGPTRPEKAAEKLEVHPEFNISLVASEPLVNKVMNVDWDEKGRLWVCETPEYPNGRREQNTDPWKDAGSLYPGKFEREPQDRISWLEDTNGDGVMDKKHVFADKLELVTSFCFYKNGVIACSAPDIWYLEDTTNDGVCNKRTKLYTGLGIGDTHAVINNLRWGLDGWVYATHGYSAGHVTSSDGSKDFGVDGSGVVRFKPDGSAFEQFSSRGGNTWGLDMTWDGQCFWTQPTSGTVFFHTVLPESVLAKGKIPGTTSWKGMITGQKTYPLLKWEQQAYVQIDQVGSYTAAAGCAIYEGGAWPDKWKYSYFTGEPTINIVSHYFVRPEGVSYNVEKETGREETEFIRSRDMWFRPIEERIGPDGALYIVDFYNQAVIHNDTRGPLHGPANAAVRPDRDHYFSRIWKVQHKEAKKLNVPVLDRMNIVGLIDALNTSPNAHVKQTAFRLLSEHGKLLDITSNASKLKDHMQKLLVAYANLHPGPSGERPSTTATEKDAKDAARFGKAYAEAVVKAVNDDKTAPAILAELNQGMNDKNLRAAFIERFLRANDAWTQSAIVAAASSNPQDFLSDCLQSTSSDRLGPFVSAVLPSALKSETQSESAARLISACSAAPSSSNGLKATILQSIASTPGVTVEITPALADSIKTLLSQPETAGATLPISAKWDKGGSMTAVVMEQVASLQKALQDSGAPDEARKQAARSLLGVRQLDQDILSKVASALTDEKSSESLQRGLVDSLGEAGDADSSKTLVHSYPKLKPAIQSSAFDQILKRPEATLELLNAVRSGEVKPGDLGPANVARLRTHPDKRVARQATTLMDKLSPQTAQKNEVIAKLTPEVEKPGNAANGKVFFTATCSVCHKLGDVGRDVAPPLTGMGAHGPAELLVHVVDPNREVDPSFWQWNITKKNGDVLVGVIAQENQASLTLRNQAGEFEVRKDEINTRENTRRSLMPEGFEALGPDVLRDILAFICGSETKFRIVDLKSAYTADSRRGLFQSDEALKDTVHFAKFGNVTVDGVPFYIMDPAKSSNGSNLIALKGGGGKAVAQSYPQRVEVPARLEAKRLHLLSGIAGWGYPATKEAKPTLKLTITHADGQSEITEFINGEHFADYNRVIEVPGSDLAEGLVTKGQLRLISVDITKPGPIASVALESHDNGVTPIVVAMTADIPGAGPAGKSTSGPSDASAKPAANPKPGPKKAPREEEKMPDPVNITWEQGKKKVLIVAGGSSHDFKKWFEEADSAFLKAAGYSVNATENSPQATEELKNADVAIISTNRTGFDTEAWRKALFDFVAAGKGVIMLHPGTWYGFPQWPELNAKIVGGGARGHDALGPFSVSVLKADHPIMKGVPASFEVFDELYYMNATPPAADAAPIEILAQTSPSKKFNQPHPSVWTTKNDKARIVGIALGHDQRVHDLPAFKSILINSVEWVSTKP